MPQERPNIIYIVADQYNHAALSCLDHPVVNTPNLDALAADGTLFSSTYCASMACGPSRACMFSGLHADRHGSQNNHIEYANPDQPVLPELLTAAGYDTALVGKLHLKPFNRHFGFRYFMRNDAPYTNYLRDEAYDSAYVKYLADELYDGDIEAVIRRFTEDESNYPNGDEARFILGTDVAQKPEHHEAAWCVRESIKYMGSERDKDKPFFLNIGIYGPHQPYLCPPPWDLSMYPPETIPLPESFYTEMSGKPLAQQKMFMVDRRHQNGWREDDWKRMMSAYYGYVSFIDHCLGELFDWMKDNGLWDNTIVIFTADHGDYNGQYKLFYKGSPHEGSTHVPLIIRHPEALHGERIDRELSNLDLFAACLNWAGTAIPEDTDSRDMSVIFEESPEAWEPGAFFKNEKESMLTRNSMKLMRGLDGDKVIYEFYDLNEDPQELNNLFDSADYAEVITAMKEELDERHRALDAVTVTGPSAR